MRRTRRPERRGDGHTAIGPGLKREDAIRTLAHHLELIRLALDGVYWRAGSSVLDYDRDIAPVDGLVEEFRDVFAACFGPLDELIQTDRPADGRDAA